MGGTSYCMDFVNGLGIFPDKSYGNTALSADGAGKQGQIPVSCFHGFQILGLDGFLCRQLKADDVFIHIGKNRGVSHPEVFNLSKVGSVVVGADDEIIPV